MTISITNIHKPKCYQIPVLCRLPVLRPQTSKTGVSTLGSVYRTYEASSLRSPFSISSAIFQFDCKQPHPVAWFYLPRISLPLVGIIAHGFWITPKICHTTELSIWKILLTMLRKVPPNITKTFTNIGSAVKHSTLSNHLAQDFKSVTVTFRTLSPMAFPRLSLGALKVHMHPAVWHQVPAPSASRMGSVTIVWPSILPTPWNLRNYQENLGQQKFTTERDFCEVSKVNRWLFSRTWISWPYPREISTCRQTHSWGSSRTSVKSNSLKLKCSPSE